MWGQTPQNMWGQALRGGAETCGDRPCEAGRNLKEIVMLRVEMSNFAWALRGDRPRFAWGQAPWNSGFSANSDGWQKGFRTIQPSLGLSSSCVF